MRAPDSSVGGSQALEMNFVIFSDDVQEEQR